MTPVSKSESSLTSFNISWVMVMRRVFWSKFSSFGTNFAATCFRSKLSEKIAWHESTDIVIHLFSTFCEELVPLVNTFLTYSILTVCHFQHFKCFWALNSICYTKFDAYSLIHFFRQQKIANTRKILLTFMPLTDEQKMLYCWNYEHAFGTSVPT